MYQHILYWFGDNSHTVVGSYQNGPPPGVLPTIVGCSYWGEYAYTGVWLC